MRWIVPRTFDQLFVGGDWRAPVSGDRLDIASPHDGSPVGSAPSAGAADINVAVEAARTAFDEGPWPRMGVAERIAALRPFVDSYEKIIATMGRLVTAEMGTPKWFAELVHGVGPHLLASSTLDFAASYAWEERRGGSLLRREPVGVVGAITPWNVPQVTIMSKLMPALVVGCTVIVKPAPETPLDAMLLATLLAEADLPPGVAAVVPGGTAAGRALVQHAGVDKISFTGSADVGRWIARECADRLARCTLELGGKSAAIICPDASLDETIEGLKFAAYLNSGEACVAQTRVLAPRSNYAQVAAGLTKMVDSLVTGDPQRDETYIGPLVSARHRARVHAYLEIGVAEGATVAAGGPGRVAGTTGHYVRPTLFTDVSNDMRIAREEIFGPVVAVIPYDDTDDAVRIANDSQYGLAGSVWTADRQAGLEIARRIRTGTFGINAYAPEFGVPFGGFKASGIGREYGPESLEAYAEVKSIYGV
jgi:aldehyde dehydrogenase (NAD+)